MKQNSLLTIKQRSLYYWNKPLCALILHHFNLKCMYILPFYISTTLQKGNCVTENVLNTMKIFFGFTTLYKDFTKRSKKTHVILKTLTFYWFYQKESVWNLKKLATWNKTTDICRFIFYKSIYIQKWVHNLSQDLKFIL